MIAEDDSSYYSQSQSQSQLYEKNTKKKKRRCRSRSIVRARKRKLRAGAAAQQPHRPQQQQQQQQHPIRAPSLLEQYLCLQAAGDNNNDVYECLRYLRYPLPTSFRIRNNSAAVQQEWKTLCQRYQLEAYEIPFVSGAWQLLSSKMPDKYTCPALYSWLATKTKCGDISRQEIVSMLPVQLLQIQSHHAVLDLCASPGSKTVQAVDSLYNNTTTPKGFVIANELDPKRAYILANRCRQTLQERMKSLAITCHNATKFPNVEAPLRKNNQANNSQQQQSLLLFDRIVCDVPCSGDGTLRKDLKVWKTWHPSFGMTLHELQIRIAKRGIALLKIGGQMTYSTCSFNPIENEAVVAALLQTGAVEVVAPSPEVLRGCYYRSGWTNWNVLNDELLQELSSADNPKLPKTLWPPASKTIQESLQNCIRMVPQDNDTGGFFIALLRKVKELPKSNSTTKAGKKNCDTSLSWVQQPMVTSIPDQHKLYPVIDDKEQDDDSKNNNNGTLSFVRSSTGKRIYQLSESLANYMTKRPGSAKINLVYAGHRHKR